MGLLRKQFQISLAFSQNLILQKAFETVAPINEELKRTEFDRAFCKKFKLLVDSFSSFFRLRQKIGRENDPSKEKQGSPYVQGR